VDDVNAPLSAAGLPFAPVHGILEVRIRNRTTGLVTTAAIDVDLDGLGADDTAETLRAKLDAVANLSAGLTADRRLTLDAAAGFEIRFGADGSGVLAALGLNSFFTGVDSRTIGMNANVLADGRLLAAGRGGGPADGSNVVDLARVVDRPLAALGGLSVEGYYASMISRLAQSSSAESALADGSRAFRESLVSQRAQFSGVSIDEELLNMMNFQRAFQTAARFISTIDELHQVLINL
jgi:flagellar hook-associated protein 1 FlgK